MLQSCFVSFSCTCHLLLHSLSPSEESLKMVFRAFSPPKNEKFLLFMSPFSLTFFNIIWNSLEYLISWLRVKTMVPFQTPKKPFKKTTMGSWPSSNRYLKSLFTHLGLHPAILSHPAALRCHSPSSAARHRSAPPAAAVARARGAPCAAGGIGRVRSQSLAQGCGLGSEDWDGLDGLV